MSQKPEYDGPTVGVRLTLAEAQVVDEIAARPKTPENGWCRIHNSLGLSS